MADTKMPSMVITGAARGIGRHLAVAAAAAGYHVVISARSTAENPNHAMTGTLDEVASEIEAAGGSVTAVSADLAHPEGVATLIDAVRSGPGCDVLVNNAAVSFNGAFLEVPMRRWAPVIAVNLTAPVELTHALLPDMVARGSGAIVNVSSGSAVEDHALQLPYAATKAALERFATGLHSQYANTGVLFPCLRIDELVMTEAVALAGVMPEGLTRHDPAEVGRALLWMSGRPELSGRVTTMGDLRAAGRLTAGTLRPLG